MMEYKYREEIIKILNDTRLTQADLAKLIGISRFTINNILRKNIQPSKDKLKLDTFLQTRKENK